MRPAYRVQAQCPLWLAVRSKAVSQHRPEAVLPPQSNGPNQTFGNAKSLGALVARDPETAAESDVRDPVPGQELWLPHRLVSRATLA
jgi:hypothetical protein